MEESDEEMYDDDEALDPTYKPSIDDHEEEVAEEIEAEFGDPKEIKIEAEVEEPQEMEIEAVEEPQHSTSRKKLKRKQRNTHSGKETTMRFYPLIRGICQTTDHLITHHYCN